MKQQMAEPTQAPRVPRHLPRSGPLTLGDHAEIREVQLDEVVIPAQGVSGVIIEQVRLRRANFASARVIRPRVSDAIFERCDFTAGEWIEAHFLRVEFEHCRMLGARWASLDAHQVRLTDCQCEGSFFVTSRLPGVRFERCSLRQASFEGADLGGASFHECVLDEADFRGAILAGADLRGCSINGLRVEARDLNGAIFDPAQSMQVAGLLGIVVKDRDEP